MPDIRATVSRRANRAGGRRTAPIRGSLSSLPRVGAPLIVFVVDTDGRVDRLITSLVERVLNDGDGTLFVETRQSVYRVELDEPIVELPRPTRMRVSVDGFELTVTDACDDDADDVESND